MYKKCQKFHLLVKWMKYGLPLLQCELTGEKKAEAEINVFSARNEILRVAPDFKKVWGANLDVAEGNHCLAAIFTIGDFVFSNKYRQTFAERWQEHEDDMEQYRLFVQKRPEGALAKL